jgi:phosphoketolase
MASITGEVDRWRRHHEVSILIAAGAGVGRVLGLAAAPLSDPATHPEHLKLLEDWLRSYRPEELFDEQGRLKPELAELAPKGERRMGANPHANGGILHPRAADAGFPRLRGRSAHAEGARHWRHPCARAFPARP